MERNAADILSELQILRAQAGSSQAFAEVVRIWHPRLHRFAARLLGDSELAQDVMQEVWLGIAKGLSQLHDPSLFPNWSHRLVRNKCADCIKRHAKDRALVTVQSDLVEQVTAKVQEAAEHDDTERIRVAFRHMPTDRRVLLTMLYVDGLTLDQIATRLNIPVGTVKSRLFHARQELAQMVAQQGAKNEGH